jgi:hypothetical protein
MNGVIHDLDGQMLEEEAFVTAGGSEWRYTEEGLAFLPPGDSLGRSARMPVTGRYSVLGVPLELETNAPAFLPLMNDLFPEWEEPWPYGDRILRLRVLLTDHDGRIPQDGAAGADAGGLPRAFHRRQPGLRGSDRRVRVRVSHA